MQSFHCGLSSINYQHHFLILELLNINKMLFIWHYPTSRAFLFGKSFNMYEVIGNSLVFCVVGLFTSQANLITLYTKYQRCDAFIHAKRLAREECSANKKMEEIQSSCILNISCFHFFGDILFNSILFQVTNQLTYPVRFFC